MRPSCLAFLLLVLCSCGDGRWAPGYLITADGETRSNTDENYRAITIETIVSELDAQLGGHWRVEAAIAELPRYEGNDGVAHSGWLWAKATATITLIGDGSIPPPLDEAQITAAVRDYLTNKVDKPHRNLTITTTRVVDAARFVQKPGKTAAGKPVADRPATPAPTSVRTYTVQAGDTWADLSMAFYGTAQHWRTISDANQGGELTVGRAITIPPKP